MHYKWTVCSFRLARRSGDNMAGSNPYESDDDDDDDDGDDDGDNDDDDYD